MEDMEDIIDEEENTEESEPYITGKAVTFKTGEVARIIGETPAMTRYYCREFEKYLSLEHEPGKHRFYSKRNVNELKYILRLIKNDGLSVKQVHEFLSSPEGKLAAPIFDQQTKFRELIEIMTSRVDGTIKDVIKREIENSFSSVFSETLKNATDKLPSKEDVEGIKIEINSLSEKTRSDYKALERNMEKIMEELQENKREKGLFGRLFGK